MHAQGCEVERACKIAVGGGNVGTCVCGVATMQALAVPSAQTSSGALTLGCLEVICKFTFYWGVEAEYHGAIALHFILSEAG